MAERRLQPWTRVSMREHRGEPLPPATAERADEGDDGGPRLVPGKPRPLGYRRPVSLSDEEIPLIDQGSCEIDCDLRFPRGMDYVGFVEGWARNHGVEVVVQVHRRGWLRERYDITLRGRRHDVKQVWQRIVGEMRAWNRCSDGIDADFGDMIRPTRRF